MIPYILVLAILAFIVVILFYTKKNYPNENKTEILQTLKGKPCQICHWPLQKNERVHSIIYRSENDIIMHIYGCPYCYKEHPKTKFNINAIRKCPACKKELLNKEFAIARLFEKPGKNHVHVLGCYRCRGKR